MHEQPCGALWDINYIPQKNQRTYLPYIAGFFLLAVPIMPLLGGVSFHDLLGSVGIAYFCIASTIA